MFHSFLSIQRGSSYTQQIALPLLHGKQLEHNVTNTHRQSPRETHNLTLAYSMNATHCLNNVLNTCSIIYIILCINLHEVDKRTAKFAIKCIHILWPPPVCVQYMIIPVWAIMCKQKVDVVTKMLIMIVSSTIRHLLIVCRCKSKTLAASRGLPVVLTPLDTLWIMDVG